MYSEKMPRQTKGCLDVTLMQWNDELTNMWMMNGILVATNQHA